MQENEGKRVTLSPQGATIFLGVLAATYMKTIKTHEDIESVIGSLATQWSIAQERLPGQVELTAATDEHNIRVLLDALADHLRMSFELRLDPSD